MDAVKFLKEVKRMCSSIDCSDCPISPINNSTGLSCWAFSKSSPQTAVSIIEEWSQENPAKTRLQDFLEKYPRSMVNGNGFPLFLPYMVGYCGDTDEMACGYCRRSDSKHPEKCWNMPLEE